MPSACVTLHVRHTSGASDSVGACISGWALSGLLPEPGAASFEVNSVSRIGKEVVVAGTSWGELRLARYPTVENAHCKVVRAHVSAVSAVRYTEVGSANRCCVFSAGGAELAIFYWRVRKARGIGEADAAAAGAARLSQVGPKRLDDIQLLSEPLSSPAGLPVGAAQPSGAWRSTMLNPPLGDSAHQDVVPNWGSSFSRMALSDLDIRLERVQGYRGYDCRGNLLAGNGLVIWFVGRVVVISDETGKQRFYTQHTDDIACIAKSEPASAAGAAGDDGAEEEEEEAPPLVMASAAVGSGGDVHVWDTGALAILATLPHGFPVRHVSFSPHEGASLATVGGHEGARTLTVWDWKRECQLVDSACDDNAPVLDLKCNPHYDPQSSEQDQIWAVTCGPRGVTFWAMHEPAKDGARYKLTPEHGGLHHVSDHSPDPMAVCAHFVSSCVVVTGMINGDLVTWRGAHSISRVRLAHPGGVFDMSGDTSMLVSGGKDCVLRVWDVSAFKGGGAPPQSRMVHCKGMLQDRAAGVRSVCLGSGLKRGRIFAGFVSNELLEVSSADVSDFTRVCHGHTPRPDIRLEAREWLFTNLQSPGSAAEYLEHLQHSPNLGYLKYCHRRAVAFAGGASSRAAHASADDSGGGIATWHTNAEDVRDAAAATRIQGFVQFKTPVAKSVVCDLLANATVEPATPDAAPAAAAHTPLWARRTFQRHLKRLSLPDLGSVVEVGAVDETAAGDVRGALEPWPLLALCAHPSGSMGASAGRDGTVRVWSLGAGDSLCSCR